jgi:plastocyanin
VPRNMRALAIGLALPTLAVGLTACSQKSVAPGPPASRKYATTAPPSSSTSVPPPFSSSTAPTPSSAPPSSSAAVAPPTKAKATIVIRSFAYHPATLKVAPGTRITVINKDSVTHTVTDQGVFNTSLIPGGGTKTFTAPTKPGRYPYICIIHPFMHGVLIVR